MAAIQTVLVFCCLAVACEYASGLPAPNAFSCSPAENQSGPVLNLRQYEPNGQGGPFLPGPGYNPSGPPYIPPGPPYNPAGQGFIPDGQCFNPSGPIYNPPSLPVYGPSGTYNQPGNDLRPLLSPRIHDFQHGPHANHNKHQHQDNLQQALGQLEQAIRNPSHGQNNGSSNLSQNQEVCPAFGQVYNPGFGQMYPQNSQDGGARPQGLLGPAPKL